MEVKYRIFQIRNIRDVDYAFFGWRFAEDTFSMDDYKEVYSGVTSVDDADENEPYMALEELFYIFNMNRPADFTGHSLSTSDVVELDGELYYVDSIGWKHLKGVSVNG